VERGYILRPDDRVRQTGTEYPVLGSLFSVWGSRVLGFENL
jgi:hypothetical protein